MVEPADNPTSLLRKRAVWLARQMDPPSVQGVLERMPGADADVVATALRLVLLFGMCGKHLGEPPERLSVEKLKDWRDARRERINRGEAVEDKDLKDQFNKDAAQEVLHALRGEIPSDMRIREPEVEVEHEAQPERQDKKEENVGGGRGFGVVRHGEIVDWPAIFRDRDERIAQARAEAAEDARREEKRVAEALLAAERDRLAEREKSAAAALRATKANGRLVALIIAIVSLIGGGVAGVAWSRSQAQPVVPAAQVPQGGQPQHQVVPIDPPKPEPNAEPKADQPIEKKEGGDQGTSAVPKDAEKPKEVAQPGGATENPSKP